MKVIDNFVNMTINDHLSKEDVTVFLSYYQSLIKELNRLIPPLSTKRIVTINTLKEGIHYECEEIIANILYDYLNHYDAEDFVYLIIEGLNEPYQVEKSKIWFHNNFSYQNACKSNYFRVILLYLKKKYPRNYIKALKIILKRNQVTEYKNISMEYFLNRFKLDSIHNVESISDLTYFLSYFNYGYINESGVRIKKIKEIMKSYRYLGNKAVFEKHTGVCIDMTMIFIEWLKKWHIPYKIALVTYLKNKTEYLHCYPVFYCNKKWYRSTDFFQIQEILDVSKELEFQQKILGKDDEVSDIKIYFLDNIYIGENIEDIIKRARGETRRLNTENTCKKNMVSI